MTKVRCIPCSGSGLAMGGGMLTKECEHCEGRGKIETKTRTKELLNKENKHYKKAVKELMSLDPKLNQKDAQEIFDAEIEKMKD